MAAAVCLVGAVLPGCDRLLVPSDDAGLQLVFNADHNAQSITVPGDPVFRRQAIIEEIPGKIGSHAATLTAFDDGELLAAWYSYSGPFELDGSAIYMSRCPADGGAWGPPQLHIDRPQGDGNPVLYSEGERVWLFQAVVPFGWASSGIEVQRSPDRGRTWTAPTAVRGPLGANVRFPPVRTGDGRLLLPAYSDFIRRSLFFSSSDGSDWPLFASVFTSNPATNIQPSVVRLENGRLLAVMRNSDGGWLWVMASDDGGTTWSAPIDSGFPNGDSPAALVRLASGNLILVFNDSPTERRPLSVALSADDGVSWSARRVLADGESTYSYPSVVQAPDGLVHVVYSHGRLSIQHATFNEAWIVRGGA